MSPCRMGNYLQKVSYGDDTHCHLAGQETVRGKFPTEITHNSTMQDRKLFAKSFLLR